MLHAILKDFFQNRTFIIRLFTGFLLLMLYHIGLSAHLNIRIGQPSDSINYIVPKFDGNIKLDGVLNEEAWENALTLELKYEVNPGENIPAPVKTFVYVTYNASHFYVAFRALDPDPKTIQAHFKDRDNIYSDDWVGVVLDTYNDERGAFDFLCNPYGIQSDGTETSSSSDDSWDAIWDSYGRINEDGFIVEMAIPFHSLRFQRKQGEQIWGFDAVRRFQGDVQHHIGLFPRDRNNNCYLCQAFKIKGFEGAKPGKNIEINPTLTAQLQQLRANETSGNFDWDSKKLDPGITVKWGITPNIIFSGTLNPDFSQVEADAAQLELNEPFALFFDEKRPFFTEGSDFFSNQLNAVYTRMIREPLWGIKVTGKEKVNTIGSYVVQDEITNLIIPGSQSSDETTLNQPSLSSVFRYKHDVSNKYTLGVLVTDREGENYFNRVYGIDGDLRFNDKNRINFQVAGSSSLYPDTVVSEFDQPEVQFNDYALDIYYSHSTRRWNWVLSYEDYGKNFRPDQGYMPRVDYKEMASGSNYLFTNNNKSGWWSKILVGGSLYYLVDQDLDFLRNRLETYLDFSGAFKQFHLYTEYEMINEMYNGKLFHIHNFNIHHCMRPVSNLHYYLNLWFGDRIDYANTRPGKRIRFSPGFDWDIGKHLNLNIEHTYEHLNIEGGKLYTANITETHITYQFTKKMFIRSIVQYRIYKRNTSLYLDVENLPDPFTKRIYTQYLFSYKINPQSAVYLGYSDSYLGSDPDNLDAPLIQTDRGLFFKVGYAFSF